jgi:FlaA1/EpsC-like NDP-sugar epimerase
MVQLSRRLLLEMREMFFFRALLLVFVYGVIFTFSLWAAYLLRFEFVIPPIFQLRFYDNLEWIIPLKLVLFFLMGQYGVLLSYFRLPDVNRVLLALCLSSVIIAVAWYTFPEYRVPPRSVILADLLFSFLGVVGFRTALRILRQRYSGRVDSHRPARRVAIVGAGETGTALAIDLTSRRHCEIRPVVFLDDDRGKWRRAVHGIPVMGTPDDLEVVVDKYGIDGVVLAMPGASAKRIREIADAARALGLSTDIIPSFTELASGRVHASRIRPVDIADLLGRAEVVLEDDKIRGLLVGRRIMVTGAGGSIGSELCRQIVRYNPARLILVEQCEVQLFRIDWEMQRKGHGDMSASCIGDILDERRMEHLFARYQPEVVFHAAAHKHVPIMERQPAEAIKNNVFGTASMIELALRHNVETFVMISTDKAINPTSVMGVSKRLSEIYLQSRAAQAEEACRAAGHKAPRLLAVRFGNVLDSSGSVIPTFREQIASGGPVTVTHPEVTRYFMTIPEAVGLVLQCATQAQGGEILVLDMGHPVKILDLARQMIELSGYTPGVDIDIQFIGLRPGEKLYEELHHTDETHAETNHARIFRFKGPPQPFGEVQAFLQELRRVVDDEAPDAMKRRLQSFIPEYQPFLD